MIFLTITIVRLFLVRIFIRVVRMTSIALSSFQKLFLCSVKLRKMVFNTIPFKYRLHIIRCWINEVNNEVNEWIIQRRCIELKIEVLWKILNKIRNKIKYKLNDFSHHHHHQNLFGQNLYQNRQNDKYSALVLSKTLAV